MCTGLEIAALAAYAGGTYMEQESARNAINREAEAFRELGRNLDQRQKRVADIDMETRNVVQSLNKLYGRDEGFDKNMEQNRVEQETLANDLINAARAKNMVAPSAGEATTLGEQLVRDANIVANEKNDKFVRQQVAANANLRSLSDAISALTPELIGGNSQIATNTGRMRGESSLSDYDNRIFQQEAINARRSAANPLGSALKLGGQLAGMYSLMSAAPAAAAPSASGTGLTAGSTGGAVGLKMPTTPGYFGVVKPF